MMNDFASTDCLKLHLPSTLSNKPHSARATRVKQTAIYFAAGVLALSLGGAAMAQGIGTSGDIRGTARDTTGAVVANATVTVTQSQTGFRRTVTTNADGQYQVTGLPPATYAVTATANGFATVLSKGVVVGIGQTMQNNFDLPVASANTEVVVSGTAPLIEVDRGGQADTIGSHLIEDLPISQRDYLTFALLVPGVANSNVIAGNNDYRVQSTPQSGLSVYGSNGRGNTVTVVGGEANDDAGGVRLTVSQDAVDQFQINRNNYPAELGGASGAAINIVTKSGTNAFHGGLFGYFRNSALDARDPFAFSPALRPGQAFSLTAKGAPVKDSLSRQQFGGTLGFAIQQDKTFLFLAFEGLRQDAQDSVPLLTNSNIFAPTPQQTPILAGLAALGGRPVPCFKGKTLPAAICAFGLQSVLTIDPTAVGNLFVSPTNLASRSFVVNQLVANGGVFPFATRTYEGSARLDHRFGDNNSVFLRYSAVHRTESDPTLQSLTGYSRGTQQLVTDNTLQASYFHTFSASASNEALVQFNDNQFNLTTNDPGGPSFDVPGYAFLGRNIFLPNAATNRRYQYADNFALLHGRHSMKFGFSEILRNDNVSAAIFTGGRFEFLQLPGFLISPCLEFPTVCGLSASVAGAPISTLQAFSLGLPAFYEQGFGNPTYILQRPLTSVFAQDSWQALKGLTLNYGLRYEIDDQNGTLNTYHKDFAPRFSFAYAPGGDQKTVIRGAYGIFYAQVYSEIPAVVKALGDRNGSRQIANTLISILGVPGHPAVNSAAVYQTLAGEGIFPCMLATGQSACIQRSNLAQFGLNVSNTGPLPPGSVLFSGSKNYRPPMAQQASFSIERQIGRATSISLEYIYVHTTHLPLAIDINLLPGAPIVTGTGANGLPTNGLPYRDWGAPQCIVNRAQCFADTTGFIQQANQYQSTANALYNGGILDFKRRFSPHVSLIANYTYSKAIDQSTDFNSDFAPFDQANPGSDRSVSDFDQRHKVVVAAVLGSPYEHSKLLGGFLFSPIFNYNSGHPFNLLAGADINGDQHFTNDRPPSAPRNSGLGPDYVSFDARLTKAVNLGGERSLILTAEGFNLANRTNYASVNNLVGASFGTPFNVHGTSKLSPSEPLGFTADVAKRQLQFGARFAF
jgi:hypothetical protein